MSYVNYGITSFEVLFIINYSVFFLVKRKKKVLIGSYLLKILQTHGFR